MGVDVYGWVLWCDWMGIDIMIGCGCGEGSAEKRYDGLAEGSGDGYVWLE